jgi:urease accessory protein
MIPSLSASGDGGLPTQAFLRLLQLASPTLPIGAFAYSQGLESAVTAGLITDEVTAQSWILGLLQGPVTSLDLAVFVRIHAALVTGDQDRAVYWNDFLFASRATAELQAEDRHLGAALGRVLDTLGLAIPDPRTSGVPATFVSLFARATAHWTIELRAALAGFAFAWAEAQVSAAVRLVPLGQSSGIRILAEVGRAIPAAVDRALTLPDDEVGGPAPRQAILSSAHETQYSRLFRS